MSFSIAAEAKLTLEECGYTFSKREEDGWWQMLEGETVVAVKRSVRGLIMSLVDSVVLSLQPDMVDYADNAQFYHWMDYACELDEIALVNYRGEDLVAYLNKRIEKYPSAHAVNHACTDVASTLESVLPTTYKGVFKYV